MPKRVKRLLRQWKQVLLWGARNLEALMMTANAAPCPPVLGCLPQLKYLELTLQQTEAWLGCFFVDLSFCYCLESLKITHSEEVDHDVECSMLPQVQLNSLPRLKRVELMGWYPEAEFSLPQDCELCVNVTFGQCVWGERWDAVQEHLTVLSLSYVAVRNLQTWRDGFDRLSRLQCFIFECAGSLTLDLAELKAIPHVELYVGGTARLSLTDGAWQNLEVNGRHGLRITFTDADAFVRGTQRFLLLSGDVDF